VTPDETAHLPVGLRYWDTGEFWAYHHNPPLTRLVHALPLVLLDVRRIHADLEFRLHERGPDGVIADDFRLLHRSDYIETFALARLMGVAFAVVGGWVVYCWARDLFGESGGLLALALWTFCPFILGHAGLVTPDVGVTSLCVAASYQFWRYLRAPSMKRSACSGVLLGLAEGAKFSAVILPPVWFVLALAAFGCRTRAGQVRPRVTHHLRDAVLLTGISLVTLNSLYLWEGTGQKLGTFPLRSTSLTREVQDADDDTERQRLNRFANSRLGAVRVPLPRHYILGFDDQLWDMEQRGFYKYLRGELRGPEQTGWWYYYVYGLLVKWPLGTLLLVTLASLMLTSRSWRLDLTTELSLLLPPLAVIALLSLKTGLNSHIRYIVPALPFLMIHAARVMSWRQSGRVWRTVLVAAAVVWSGFSVVGAHPHYLAYFNEAAGGPRAGIRHLADSNLDWGQGLLGLRDWLEVQRPGQTISLAYFGGTDPRDVGLRFKRLDPRDPEPGIHAIGASILAGVPNVIWDVQGNRIQWGADAFHAYRELQPIEVPGYSIYVFEVSESDATMLRRRHSQSPPQ
jgi:hypothetical protein